MKLKYELVAAQADIFLMKMITTGNLEYWWDYYQAYIIACGWDNESLDRETLPQVDEAWEDISWN